MAKTTIKNLELTIFRKVRKNGKGKEFDTFFATKNNGDNFNIDGNDCGATINIKLWDEVSDTLLESLGDGADFPVGVVLSPEDFYVKRKTADNSLGVSCIYYTLHIKSVTKVTEPVIKQIVVE